MVEKNREGGDIIKCMTYVPFILIASKEPRLIKLTSDALFSSLINGCGNHREKSALARGGYGTKWLLFGIFNTPTSPHVPM